MLFLVEAVVSKKIFRIVKAEDKFLSWEKVRKDLKKEGATDKEISIIGSRIVTLKETK